MKCDELTPIELECDMGKDINGVEHREPWKAYDIDEVDAAIAELKEFAEDACLERDDNQTAIDELQDTNKLLAHNGVRLNKMLDEKDKEIALLKERICNGDVSRLTWIDDCIAKDNEIAELKNENLNLKAKNIELQSFYDLHGNVDNYIDELKAKNSELKQKLENVQASMYADVVDANMEIRRLKRALWLILADLHSKKAQEYANESLFAGMWLDDNDEKQCTRKEKCSARCRAKAEEYK